jgi:hypothetical protein
MSKIQVTNINDLSDNASLITQSGGIKSDKLTGVTTAGSILVTGEGNSTTTNLQQGLAKAWAKTNAAGTSIEDSNNVSSLTDNGSGDQTITMTNAMGNALYAISIGNHSQNSAYLILRSSETATTTTVYRTGAYQGGYTDCQIGSIAMGDLA